MIGGAVYQQVLRHLVRSELPEIARRDVVAALRAAPRDVVLAILVEAGAAAGVEPAAVDDRAAAVFFSYVGGSLADDLADGDCDYLDDPLRTGPSTQFILQNLFFSVAAGAGIPSPVLHAAALDLARAAAPQQLEVRTKKWTAPLLMQVADGEGGLQWSAYLRLLWHGSPLEAKAPSIGVPLGRVAFVADDARSRDRRFGSLSRADKRTVLAWTAEACDALRRERLPFLDLVLASCEPVLKNAA